MSRRSRVTFHDAMQWRRPGTVTRPAYRQTMQAGSGSYHVVAYRGGVGFVLVSCRDALAAELAANHYRAGELEADEIRVELDATPRR